MSISVFLELVEIYSLSASILSILLGSLYSYYRYGVINWTNFIMFFVTAVVFHMAVNVHDNLQDYLNETNPKPFVQKPMSLV